MEQLLLYPVSGLLACLVFGHSKRKHRQGGDFCDLRQRIQRGASSHRRRCKMLEGRQAKGLQETHHWIMKPSDSGLLQTHLVVPLRELEGVAPSGSVIVVGERLVEEPYPY